MREKVENLSNNEEQIEILSDKELSSLYTDDDFKIYIQEITSYQLLSIEEQKELAKRYRKGDEEAKQQLINSNLRLVVSIAKKYFNLVERMQPLDIIQDGNLGLIRAVETYDPSLGAFSTYAFQWIRQTILRGIANKDKEIRHPVHFIDASVKYSKLISDYVNKNKQIPSDNIICKKLNITLEMLNNIKKSRIGTVSLNKQVVDEEDTELESFVPSDNNDFENLFNRLDEEELMIILKEIIKPSSYFILYHRILNNKEIKTLEELASIIGLTRERVRQIEQKTLFKIKPIITNKNNKYTKILEQIRIKEGNNLKKLKIEPLNPNEIIKYLYLKDKLECKEEKMLYLMIFGKYRFSKNDYARELETTIEGVLQIYESLKNKVKSLKNNEDFKEFARITRISYGTKIFYVEKNDLNDNSTLTKSNKQLIDRKNLENKYGELTFTEINEYFNSVGCPLKLKQYDLLQRYFSTSKEKTNIPIEELIYEINKVVYGYSYNETNISIKELYNEYLKIKNDFSESQQLYIESYIFNIKDKKEFNLKYPDSNHFNSKSYFIEKLEKSYFNILNFYENNFTKENYLKVKRQYKDKFTEEKLKILDMYFEIDGKEYTINDIASILGMDYTKTRDLCYKAREFAMNLYAGISSTVEIDKKIYKPYINSINYSFTDETRNILKMFINQNLSYDEISEQTGLSLTRISNIITNGLRKIDFYRFNIIEERIITYNELKSILNFYKDKFSSIEKNILKYKLIKKYDNDFICRELNVDSKLINKASLSFNKYYFLYKIKSIVINLNDIQKEISSHKTESILTEEEKKFASFYYGIQNDYNPNTLNLNQKDLMNKFNITKKKYCQIEENIINKIKGRKAGILKQELSYMPREELDKLLDDVHLPLSAREKDLICYLFELKGYPYKTLDELAIMFNNDLASIKRRYQRSIVSLYKYKNGEIAGVLDYEQDIVPLLKYFSISDRLKIEDFYKNELNYEKLAKKYNVTFNQIVKTMQRIKKNIFDLINNKDAKKFDFDYYLEAIKNPYLPFYGNLELTIQIFNLAFGMDGKERLSIPEIIQKLNLDIKRSQVSKYINNLMLSVCKLKNGIKKDNLFTLDDVYSYYVKNNQNIDNYRKSIYGLYFKRCSDNNDLTGLNQKIPYIIINDLCKYLYVKTFSFDNVDREDILNILKKYNNELDFNIKDELMAIYDIKEKEIMSEKDLVKVFELLDVLDKKLLSLNNFSLRKINKSSR